MENKLGTVTIAPHVLATVAAHAAQSVRGVARLSTHRPVRVERLLGRMAVNDGVSVMVTDGVVSVDLYLVFARTANMLETSRQAQAEVARAINDVVGMTVSEINVHVEDVAVDVTSDR